MVISMLKIRRPLGRLIFNMGIAIPGKTVFLIEMAPWFRRYGDIGNDTTKEDVSRKNSCFSMFSPCSKPPEQRILAQKAEQSTGGYMGIFHKHYCHM